MARRFLETAPLAPALSTFWRLIFTAETDWTDLLLRVIASLLPMRSFPYLPGGRLDPHLNLAFDSHPERLMNNLPQPLSLPEAVWVNSPKPSPALDGKGVVLP